MSKRILIVEDQRVLPTILRDLLRAPVLQEPDHGKIVTLSSSVSL
jgi:hypothetical protein